MVSYSNKNATTKAVSGNFKAHQVFQGFLLYQYVESKDIITYGLPYLS